MDSGVRASDADRQRVVVALEHHTTAGRLKLDEFEERVEAALHAVTLGELVSLTRDLPIEAPNQAVSREDPSGGASEGQTEARSLVVAFLLAAVTLMVLGVLLAIAR